MGVPFLDQGPMRVEEFYAFTDTRPDEEKWELIDGEPLLNPTPSYLHQKIVRNLIVLLGEAGPPVARRLGGSPRPRRAPVRHERARSRRADPAG